MPDGNIHDWATRWQATQQAFWSAAADRPAFADASAFAPPDWQAFDGFAARMIAQVPPGTGVGWQAAHAAMAAYRDVIAATWSRIQQQFEVQRRALQGLGDPDWRIYRDRWVQVAEAEFLKTQRTEEFVTAQRDLLRAAIGLWSELPAEALAAARQGLSTAQTAARTMADLGLDGVRVGATPKTEIWRHGQTSLSRYLPLDGATPSLGPVLICHGLIGRQTMIDLQPDRSLVRTLLAAGVDVFVVDWGDAGPGDADLGLDHFAGRMMGTCVAKTSAAAGGAKPVLFGICQGGTMAACHAAANPGTLAGLITAVAPFDFHADDQDPDPAHGLLNLWLRSLNRQDVDRLLDLTGTLPGALMGAVFNQLNPVRTLAKYAIDLAEQATAPGGARVFLAMEKWLADRPDLPAAMGRTWLSDLYLDNALVAGRLKLAGKSVDLATIDVPVLNIFATRDHIVPPPCSRALQRLIRTPCQELAIPAGHIGTFVSAKAQSLLSPGIIAWMLAQG